MAEMKEGGCACGDIRYQFSCEPLSCYACHCTDCQTRSGAAFTLTTIVPLAEVNVTRGDPGMFEHEIGNFVNCKRCGSRLWSIWHALPDFALVAAGTLDDTSWVRPVAHLWTGSAQSWIGLNDDAATFEGQPEDPTILIELWNKRHESRSTD